MDILIGESGALTAAYELPLDFEQHIQEVSAQRGGKRGREGGQSRRRRVHGMSSMGDWERDRESRRVGRGKGGWGGWRFGG
eukprot:390964-Rhodomonas_salina.1